MRSMIIDGQLFIPMRAESEDGKIIGDGMVPIDNTHPDYEKWFKSALRPDEFAEWFGDDEEEEVEKGGPGSGSWDGPGQPRFRWGGPKHGPAPAPPPRMLRSKTIDGQRVQWDGTPLPAHIQALKIPPAWIKVSYSTDPNADMLVKGKPPRGKFGYIYSERHNAERDAAKYAKENELAERFDSIYTENKTLMQSNNPETREAAACLNLIMETGIRPGSEEKLGRKKAYGATTLEGRHLVELKRGTELHFQGKRGVAQKIPITNEDTVRDLRERAQKAGPEGRLFNTDEDLLLEHAKKLDGGGFRTKDFRTHIGTRTAIKAIAGMKVPTTFKEYKKAVREVGKIVAKKLGNTPTVALQAYINPTVFAGWRAAHERI